MHTSIDIKPYTTHTCCVRRAWITTSPSSPIPPPTTAIAPATAAIPTAAAAAAAAAATEETVQEVFHLFLSPPLVVGSS